MTRGLVIVDIQRDYFPGGAYPLVEPEAAAGAARRVLDHFRAEGEPVVRSQVALQELAREAARETTEPRPPFVPVVRRPRPSDVPERRSA